MTDDVRQHWAAAQEQLVAHLMHGKVAPTGFVQDELTAAARSLIAKRFRLVQLAWPVFSTALATEFHRLFMTYAHETPLCVEVQGRQDGCRFARWLLKKQQLPDAVQLVLLRVELQGCVQPRRGFSIQFAWLRQRRRLAWGIKLPGCSAWVLPVS